MEVAGGSSGEPLRMPAMAKVKYRVYNSNLGRTVELITIY